jgi:hypothetical protein
MEMTDELSGRRIVVPEMRELGQLLLPAIAPEGGYGAGFGVTHRAAALDVCDEVNHENNKESHPRRTTFRRSQGA